MLWCSLHFLSVYLSVLYCGRDLIFLASTTVYLRLFAFPGPGHFMTKWLPTSLFHSWFGRPAFPFAVSANDCGWFILLACSDSIGHIFCDFDPCRMPASLTCSRCTPGTYPQICPPFLVLCVPQNLRNRIGEGSGLGLPPTLSYADIVMFPFGGALAAIGFVLFRVCPIPQASFHSTHEICHTCCLVLSC